MFFQKLRLHNFPTYNKQRRESLLTEHYSFSFGYFAKSLFCVFTALIAHGAGCFACGLAGCLTLAAAALFHGFLQISRVQRFNMFHLILILHSYPVRNLE